MFGRKNEPVQLVHNGWGSFIKIPNDGYFWNKHHTYFVLSSADDIDLTEDGIFCTTFVNYPVDKMKVRVMSSEIYPQFMIMEIDVRPDSADLFEQGLEKLMYRLNFKIKDYRNGSSVFWKNIYKEAEEVENGN